MTDPSARDPEQRLPARRPASQPSPADRFSAPPASHAGDLSPERAATIVRQTANARLVGFFAVVVIVLFSIIYWFYEIGAPLGLSTPRLDQQDEAQQVTAVERGYNLYQANCARCHGPNGKGTDEGWTAPALNDQMKLLAHLNEAYLRTVLTVGGRYVCGNPDSQMPVWSNENGGPLNYRQIEEIIAFIRSDAAEEYLVKHPELNEPVLGEDGQPLTFRGWVDSDFVPDPAATPVPDCYLGDGASQAPSETLGPDAVTLEVSAELIAYDTLELEAPAGVAFGIHFVNKDEGIPHDVDIELADRTMVQNNAVLQTAGETTYVIAPLEAGTYTFICSVHPIPAMTGTLTVK
jgi:mono/diheme cytochrome c family protein/plastocyanin